MKNVKDIVIGIFALIGFFAIASGFSNNQAQAVTHTVPESHVWSMHFNAGDGSMYTVNAVSGEVRQYENNSTIQKKYHVMTEKLPKQKKK